jgi:predicted transcriptional regulator
MTYQPISAGLRTADEGRVVSHKDVKKKFLGL